MLCVWEGIDQLLETAAAGTGAVAISARGVACPFGICTCECTGVCTPALRCFRRHMQRTRKRMAAMIAAPPTATGTAMATLVFVLMPPLSLLLAVLALVSTSLVDVDIAVALGLLGMPIDVGPVATDVAAVKDGEGTPSD